MRLLCRHQQLTAFMSEPALSLCGPTSVMQSQWHVPSAGTGETPVRIAARLQQARPGLFTYGQHLVRRFCSCLRRLDSTDFMSSRALTCTPLNPVSAAQ